MLFAPTLPEEHTIARDVGLALMAMPPAPHPTEPLSRLRSSPSASGAGTPRPSGTLPAVPDAAALPPGDAHPPYGSADVHQRAEAADALDALAAALAARGHDAAVTTSAGAGGPGGESLHNLRHRYVVVSVPLHPPRPPNAAGATPPGSGSYDLLPSPQDALSTLSPPASQHATDLVSDLVSVSGMSIGAFEEHLGSRPLTRNVSMSSMHSAPLVALQHGGQAAGGGAAGVLGDGAAAAAVAQLQASPRERRVLPPVGEGGSRPGSDGGGDGLNPEHLAAVPAAAAALAAGASAGIAVPVGQQASGGGAGSVPVARARRSTLSESFRMSGAVAAAARGGSQPVGGAPQAGHGQQQQQAGAAAAAPPLPLPRSAVMRVVVDPDFRQQFEIGKQSTERYDGLMAALPRVYVGQEERLPLVSAPAPGAPPLTRTCRHVRGLQSSRWRPVLRARSWWSSCARRWRACGSSAGCTCRPGARRAR